MKMLKINKTEAATLFGKLSCDYEIIAPTEVVGKGRFSNTNLLTYDKVGNFEEIDFSQKTYFSAKEVLFPVRESLFEFKKNNINEITEDVPPKILFLRACDINAIGIMDVHFLNNAKYKDEYYRRRRQAVKFFLIECEKPFDNCFCVSMGSNETKSYSAFMRKVDDGYEIKVNDEGLLKYLSGGVPKKVEPIFPVKDKKSINVPLDIDTSLFENEIWKEYSKRCSACGRCNTCCPTCTCFTISDIFSEDDKDTGERRRIWSSCQVKNFAILAGNHDFRTSKGDRMRYKVLHKIIDFKKSDL